MYGGKTDSCSLVMSSKEALFSATHWFIFGSQLYFKDSSLLQLKTRIVTTVVVIKKTKSVLSFLINTPFFCVAIVLASCASRATLPCGTGAARLAAAMCGVSRPRKRQALPLRGQGSNEPVFPQPPNSFATPKDLPSLRLVRKTDITVKSV